MPELTFTLMRPWWLLGFLPLVLAAFFLFRRSNQESAWEQVVDPVLHSYVIEPGESNRSGLQWLLLLGWTLSLIVLCGPVWQKQETPVYQGQQAQVVLFDLSRSMYSDDLKPSRVARARFKLLDLLEAAEGVQVALIAFAERPYVVSPLSDDANTIAAFVESLDPSIMPAQGSRLDLAIEKGIELLSQANVAEGHLVVMTDSDVGSRALTAASTVRDGGHHLSVIAVGTEKGAPLRAESGRFLQDSTGAIVVPQINTNALSSLAKAGGGLFTFLDTGNADINKISTFQNKLSIGGDKEEQQQTKEYWVEYAPFGVVLLLLLSLLFFRRGVYL